MTYFRQKLLDLLPDLYKREDKQGDLAAFLALPAEYLDEMKTRIDDLPLLCDIDCVPDDEVPLLGALVGYTLGHRGQESRREIRESVEYYRRRGTKPAILKDLGQRGWEGSVQETFQQTLRLNRRATINQSHLSGKIYSLGVYRIDNQNLVDGVREALSPHHPAGTKVFFRQWLLSWAQALSPWGIGFNQLFRLVMLGDLNETLVLNRSTINAARHLNRKKKVHELLSVSQHTTVFQDLDHATVSMHRRHGRRSGIRTNGSRLEAGKKLTNVWVSEIRNIQTCLVDIWTGSAQKKAGESILQLGRKTLNQTRLNQAFVACRIGFQQKDLIGLSAGQGAVDSMGRQTTSHLSEARLSTNFKIGHQLGGPFRLGIFSDRRPVLASEWISASKAVVSCSTNLVRRWRVKSQAFSLNAHTLNRSCLSDAYINQKTASFELMVSSEATPKARSMQLGRKRLNKAAFTKPEACLFWRNHQHDFVSESAVRVTEAINLFEVTEWPVEERL